MGTLAVKGRLGRGTAYSTAQQHVVCSSCTSSRKGGSTMIEDPRTCTLEQQTGLLGFAIASHIEQDFVLRERTATTALLVRRRRYNRLASIATVIVPYYIYFILFARDTSMALEVDHLGRVQCRQGTVRHPRRMAVGVGLALLIAMTIIGITTLSLGSASFTITP